MTKPQYIEFLKPDFSNDLYTTATSIVAHLLAALKLLWVFIDLRHMAVGDQSLPVSAALDLT